MIWTDACWPAGHKVQVEAAVPAASGLRAECVSKLDKPSMLVTDGGAPDPEREERTQTMGPIQPQQEKRGEGT